MSVLGINKPPGISSHQVALRLSRKWKIPVTHAGTLDPMAEGVMVLLAGTKRPSPQAEYQAVSKKYRFDLLFGFSTDTYDGLGVVSGLKKYSTAKFPASRLGREVRGWTSKRRQAVPPFSAKVIKGRPLFWWAREGRLKEVGRVSRKIKVSSARVLSVREVSKSSLRRRLFRAIREVDGDFRQEKIIRSWKTALEGHPNLFFTRARVEMEVSAGTYIRTIAHETGKAVGIPAFALRIQRIQSGGVKLRDCIPLETALRARSPRPFILE